MIVVYTLVTVALLLLVPFVYVLFKLWEFTGDKRFGEQVIKDQAKSREQYWDRVAARKQERFNKEMDESEVRVDKIRLRIEEFGEY
jgi:hypothetical protein